MEWRDLQRRFLHLRSLRSTERLVIILPTQHCVFLSSASHLALTVTGTYCFSCIRQSILKKMFRQGKSNILLHCQLKSCFCGIFASCSPIFAAIPSVHRAEFFCISINLHSILCFLPISSQALTIPPLPISPRSISGFLLALSSLHS